MMLEAVQPFLAGWISSSLVLASSNRTWALKRQQERVASLGAHCAPAEGAWALPFVGVEAVIG